MVLPNMVIFSISLTCLLLRVGAQENSKFEQFLEDGNGELQNFAWEALKILGGQNDTGEINVTSSVSPISTNISPISFSSTEDEFGKEVDSSSSSRQHNSGDLRNLKKQIRELDEQSRNSKLDHLTSSANAMYLVTSMPSVSVFPWILAFQMTSFFVKIVK